MGELKKHQPPMTINEEVENLKSIGLIVDDEAYAKKILNDISYLSIPAPIEPPDRSLRATIPAAQSHYSGGGNHHSGN